MLKCIFGSNLVIAPQIHYPLLCGQAQLPIILRQNGQNDLEGLGQWPPPSISAESIHGCMFGANLLIVAQTQYQLFCGIAKFHKILSGNGQNDLKGQGRWPPFSIPTESIPGCMFSANLVIPAQVCDGQGKVYGQTEGRADGQADRRRQRQYPFGLKGQGLKIIICNHSVIPKLLRHTIWLPAVEIRS